MTCTDPEDRINITLADLADLPMRKITTEIDDVLLNQLRRVLPASLAGHSEWQGPLQTPAWIRWHWYFDHAANDFVVHASSIESNITLLAHDGGTQLPPRELQRFAHRMICRHQQWRPSPPTIRSKAQKSRPAAIMPVAIAPPLQADPLERLIRDLTQLPDDRQFSQIAKIARDKFGFIHTLAVGRDPQDHSAIVSEDNFLGGWHDVYQREHLIMIDPRLHGDIGPTIWTASEQRGKNAAFWDLAVANGIGSGWLMRSMDGNFALVLSRRAATISYAEVGKFESALQLLATVAHQLMQRRLTSPARYAASRYERALPENDLEIIGYLLSGKGRKEIAATMAISIPTIDRRIRFIKKKLGAETTPQMVDLALRMGLLARAPD